MGENALEKSNKSQVPETEKEDTGKLCPLVSIVILTWNRKSDLRETLEKLRDNLYSNLEIIVVDNNSTDGTGKMISLDFQEVNYLLQKENLGIAGYNVGFKAAKGEYVVALDSDSYPAKDAITKMVGLFDENRDAGAVAFDVHTPTKQSESVQIDCKEVCNVVGYHGAGVGFRKEVFLQIGYWYEPFFLYFNEMDHALRLLKGGYRILRTPGVRAFHKSSPVARPSERTAYYYTRNALWVIWRHYPFREMLASTFYFIYLAVSESLFQRTWIYLSAVRDAFKKTGDVLSERQPVDRSLFKDVRIPLPLVFSRWT